jgi:hypothetical protein
MFNPFKKRVPEGYTEVDLDVLINTLLESVIQLIDDINELKEDLDNLTDFVEDNLD